jgi:ribonuclease R
VAKTKNAPKSQKVGKLPSKQEILDFLQGASVQAGKREIARAFGVKGGDRVALKELLRDMADDGLIAGSRRKLQRPGVLPSVTVIEIVERDSYGEFIARPANWLEEHGPPPRILIVESKQDKGPAAGIGDRVLARITPLGADADTPYQARPIKRLPRATRSQLGIFRALPGGHGVIDPVDRKQLKEWRVARDATNDAENGELVRFELGGPARFGGANARVTDRLGNPQDQRATSLIAIHAHGIPDTFPEAVLSEADAAKEPDLKRREDLRHLPFVTIDPVDARDRDDAVWAEADPDPRNKGGWVVMVAISDVASYVKPGSALDKEARARGNSVYFPDRVVPMLPERISNDLCSLQAEEARPCLAVRMVFDKDGRKREHRFFRALMRSAASLSYEQAQAAIDGRIDEATGPLLDTVLRPLWGAYASLTLARTDRAPLDLDLPERKILLDDEGRVRAIVSPPRLDAHRLIEEFMIAANVAAADTLEAKRSPLIYRVHDEPAAEKVNALREFLATLDEVVRARERGKPLVVSMGSVAASGGYFVAAPAATIVAEPGTLTGSIGVFAGKFIVKDLLAKLGINVDSVAGTHNALAESMTTDYTPEQWAALERELDRIYDDFMSKVAAGRHMDKEAVHAVAKGQIWTGADARERGLVDELGGLATAIRLARNAAGVPLGAAVRIEQLPEPETGLGLVLRHLLAASLVKAGLGPMIAGLSARLEAVAAALDGGTSATLRLPVMRQR